MKKRIFVSALAVVLVLAFSVVPAIGAQHSIYLNVNTGVNSGNAWSSGNPKDDNEQYPYLSISSLSTFLPVGLYWTVNWNPSLGENGRVNDYEAIYSAAANNQSKIGSRYWNWQGAGNILYFELDTDLSSASLSGYWYS